MITDKYTTYQISRICGVSTPTIVYWIKSGKLSAYKTLGGHRRIRKEDLIEFLSKNNFPIPKDLDFKVSNKIKILIIDNAPDILKHIEKTINKIKNGYKYSIKSATDAFEAGEAISVFKPNLIILETKIPGVNTLEICRSIRQRDAHIKILAISKNNSKENMERIIKAGANIFLPRPFNAKELILNINKVLNLNKK
ncbi:MAG: response regulator [Elusimicrobia bacterium]|nr:response regulator [Candidatus Liberimonas magnetica]